MDALADEGLIVTRKMGWEEKKVPFLLKPAIMIPLFKTKVLNANNLQRKNHKQL